MSCTHCGTGLPAGALFCGECGRSVSSTPAPARPRLSSTSRGNDTAVVVPTRWVEDPVTGESLVADAPAAALDPLGEPKPSSCEQCGTALGPDDIFCGECGFVAYSVRQAFSDTAFTGETSRLDLDPMLLNDPLLVSTEPAPVSRPVWVPEPEPEPIVEPELELEPALEEPPIIQRPPIVTATPVTRVAPVVRELSIDLGVAPPPAAAPPLSNSRPSSSRFRSDHSRGADLFGADEDIEATRIVSRLSGERFVLQFSTGESFTVHGSGLIGRNPQPEPGEFFDHLVRVLDTGKSVSKTHLEFGQEAGAFWVNDRFSGNGTVIREPDVSARRAEAGRRYRVVRGTRVDVGEQFFVIS